jgi:hypothetical protein
MANRDFTLPGPWADDAETTIPGTPTQNTPYRDTSLSEATVQDGWPFGKIVNSASFNQYLYLASKLLGQFETQGIASWSALTTYAAGGLALGSDKQVYQAIDANTNNDPADDTAGTHWRPINQSLVEFFSDANGGYIRIGTVYLQWKLAATTTPTSGVKTGSIAWPVEFPIACFAAWSTLACAGNPTCAVYMNAAPITTGATWKLDALGGESSAVSATVYVFGIGH